MELHRSDMARNTLESGSYAGTLHTYHINLQNIVSVKIYGIRNVQTEVQSTVPFIHVWLDSNAMHLYVPLYHTNSKHNKRLKAVPLVNVVCGGNESNCNDNFMCYYYDVLNTPTKV